MRKAETATARFWLADNFRDADTDPVRITPRELYDWFYEDMRPEVAARNPANPDDPNSPRARLTGPREFYRVAEEHLGQRRRIEGRAYFIRM